MKIYFSLLIVYFFYSVFGFRRSDYRDGEFTDRIVFTTSREDDPKIWFNKEHPGFEYIEQFRIGQEVYNKAQIRQTRTKEKLSTLREDTDVDLLRRSTGIKWVQQEIGHIRVPRTVDTEWSNLWYLNDDVTPTMKVGSAWSAGYTGSGIVIAVLDDGLQTDHPDLAANVDSINDIDIYSGDDDPKPPSGSSHGTQVSGLIAAVKDNNICVVGVAFSSTLIGVRLLGDSAIFDSEEAEALSHYLSNVDIYSNSWGPPDGTGFTGPGSLTKAALQDGVTNGRNGKGAIYIWAAGNGQSSDNCNGDGYVNSIYTVAISSAMIGYNAWYSEVCAPALAVAYGGSEHDRYLTTTTTSSGCKSGIQGTSYAAPLVSGIVALTLEAKNGLNDTYSDWSMNGANKEFSQILGFGLMDADAMVSFGKIWVTVPTQQTCTTSTRSPSLSTTTSATDSITVTSGDCSSVNYLEHVVADITFSYTGLRGVTEMYLVSPSGTKSHLLHYRNQDAVDNSAAGSLTWDFMSVHFWNENPMGSWTLEIRSFISSVTARESNVVTTEPTIDAVTTRKITTDTKLTTATTTADVPTTKTSTDAVTTREITTDSITTKATTTADKPTTETTTDTVATTKTTSNTKITSPNIVETTVLTTQDTPSTSPVTPITPGK
ncbi:Furin-like protease 2,Proprotein convertase subtilisin/kexin type 6,Furin-like protease 1, isoform 1-CRR,Proprotein convertase subtilisin/kexin type 5,Furin-like protease 1, isoforms 1/1-X/2 [Mytilus coruscus]|uniref:Furin-like protease 2,Proprotein convertase subtilisin/kexin type 6,Furin-like protease 1, isoform 1-CRR,Proprotein convertase subtilisin/kexin type 5,Furin-like protease 1, isoforms 1/1-X/2 n=1 Tax=Mytilus coruscus TaxID=42192 RepID=A0A6J8D529_MYTCO|nr:Furin-like protease 2,Proprotein convertase subtilisin/kexin type 6,Furin-like protease 1, isoform 1-CRR,Proprotein convertase subtilisin/kexin type 5,Furin-like protease 1, isoforms 1/1-X/2 [Mytilus coruscus]